MISLHRSMHSSQMYTPGPAISFLTCFWLFPQKEHLSRSPVSPTRGTCESFPVHFPVGPLNGRAVPAERYPQTSWFGRAIAARRAESLPTVAANRDPNGCCGHPSVVEDLSGGGF